MRSNEHDGATNSDVFAAASTVGMAGAALSIPVVFGIVGVPPSLTAAIIFVAVIAAVSLGTGVGALVVVRLGITRHTGRDATSKTIQPKRLNSGPFSAVVADDFTWRRREYEIKGRYKSFTITIITDPSITWSSPRVIWTAEHNGERLGKHYAKDYEMALRLALRAVNHRLSIDSAVDTFYQSLTGAPDAVQNVNDEYPQLSRGPHVMRRYLGMLPQSGN